MMKTLRNPTFHTPPDTALIQRGFEMRRVATREDWSDVKTLRFEALRERGAEEHKPHGGHADLVVSRPSGSFAG